MNAITSRLAARTSTNQLDALARANAAAAHVEADVDWRWRKLLRQLQSLEDQPEARTFLRVQQAVRALLQGLLRETHQTLAQTLSRLAVMGHQQTGAALSQVLPTGVLRAAALVPVPVGRRTSQGRNATFRVSESIVRRNLQEDFPPQRSGLAIFGIDADRLYARDRLGRLREPIRAEMPDAEQRELIRQLLFPPPTESAVASILQRPLFGRTWEQDLAGASRLAGYDPAGMARQLALSLSLGKNIRESAADILPMVDGVQSTARRIARTYGMQVAHHGQMAAHAALGDLVIGYQIHATLDHWTRPWHAARSGTIYYAEPGPGQKGYMQMPQPPMEATDPQERPPGTPHLAWNCRCFLAPILTPLESLPQEPAFQNLNGDLIPDPATYDEWFDQADEQRRILAVGAKRYQAAQEFLNKAPQWAHFMDPESGDLLSLTRLKAEKPAERLARVARVNAVISRRRAEISAVAQFGFV